MKIKKRAGSVELSDDELYDELLALKHLLEAGFRQTRYISDCSKINKIGSWIVLCHDLVTVLDGLHEVESALFD